jgi:hypothetical protein
MVRRMITLGVALLILCGLGISGVEAQNKKDLSLRIELDIPPDFAPPGTRGGSAFYIRGTICAEQEGPACTEVGVFHCWGWQSAPNTPANEVVVSQSFKIYGRGSIEVQGVEAFGPAFIPRAVVGGTGDFKNVSGEMTSADLAIPFLSTTFRLKGAKK